MNKHNSCLIMFSTGMKYYFTIENMYYFSIANKQVSVYYYGLKFINIRISELILTTVATDE